MFKTCSLQSFMIFSARRAVEHVNHTFVQVVFRSLGRAAWNTSQLSLFLACTALQYQDNTSFNFRFPPKHVAFPFWSARGALQDGKHVSVYVFVQPAGLYTI